MFADQQPNQPLNLQLRSKFQSKIVLRKRLQVEFEVKEPADGVLATLDNVPKDPMSSDAAIVTRRDGCEVDETDPAA